MREHPRPMLVRFLILLGCWVASVPTSALAAEPPQLAIVSGLPAGWVTSGDYSVAVTGSSAARVDSVGVYVDDERLKPQFECLLTRSTCPSSATVEYTVRSAEFSDGQHELVASAKDADGQITRQQVPFLVDRTAPAAPANVVLEGGDGWRRDNRFGAHWALRDGDGGSPVVAARYEHVPPTRTSGVSRGIDPARRSCTWTMCGSQGAARGTYA